MHNLYQADFGHNFFTLKTPQLCPLHGGKIEQNPIFQNLTSTCKDPTAANHTLCMVTPKYLFFYWYRKIYTASLLFALDR